MTEESEVVKDEELTATNVRDLIEKSPNKAVLLKVLLGCGDLNREAAEPFFDMLTSSDRELFHDGMEAIVDPLVLLMEEFVTERTDPWWQRALDFSKDATNGLSPLERDQVIKGLVDVSGLKDDDMLYTLAFQARSAESFGKILAYPDIDIKVWNRIVEICGSLVSTEEVLGMYINWVIKNQSETPVELLEKAMRSGKLYISSFERDQGGAVRRILTGLPDKYLPNILDVVIERWPREAVLWIGKREQGWIRNWPKERIRALMLNENKEIRLAVIRAISEAPEVEKAVRDQPVDSRRMGR